MKVLILVNYLKENKILEKLVFYYLDKCHEISLYGLADYYLIKNELIILRYGKVLKLKDFI